MEDPQALIQQAEKLVSKGSSGWSFFGGSEDKFWDAARLFREAAQAYERQGQKIEAGKTHERAAAVREKKLKELGDAADSYIEASAAYEKDDPEAAIRCGERAFTLIQQSTSESKQTRLSRVKAALGEIYEKQLHDLKRAREAYKEAAERLPMLREQNANSLFTKYADLAARDEEYLVAIETYNRIIDSMIGKSTMQWSISSYCFKASICALATRDEVEIKRAIRDYPRIDGLQTSKSKYELIKNLWGAVQEQSLKKFEDFLLPFDSMLDKWMVDILLKVKNKIEVPDNDDNGASQFA